MYDLHPNPIWAQRSADAARRATLAGAIRPRRPFRKKRWQP